MSVKEVSSSKCFGGHQKVFSHESETVGCTMKFSLYVPPNVEVGEKVPVLYFLSGLTCTEENFIIKSGFQRYAAQYKICVVGPDTSPRGLGIQGEDDYYDLGTGAGFYVNATEEKWKKNYRMYSYVTEELPNLIEANFDFIMPNKRSISGHSMGGHGALICALKNPGRYMVATAFAPIANPIASPWGRKVFTSYLGSNQEAWKEYDATHLVASYNGPPLHILVDQGSEDQFLKDQLMPQNLVNACLAAKVPIIYREQDGYDHSYFFVASFLEDHFKHHARVLYS